MSIRTLLIDDEQPARERLARLLQSHGDVEIVGEAEDGEQAIERIEQLSPDLIFLDIQMPGCSGMEVAASLSAPRPKIVFCTAFDEYAVDAFELQAIDYLLKPVSRSRLERALDRVRTTVSETDESIDLATRHPSRFLAKRGTKYHVIPRSNVVAFVSDRGLTKLVTAEQHYWMQPTLSDLEQRLDPGVFMRISRATIVNLDAVREVQPQTGGQGELSMVNGKSFEVSRRRYKELIQHLAGDRGSTGETPQKGETT